MVIDQIINITLFGNKMDEGQKHDHSRFWWGTIHVTVTFRSTEIENQYLHYVSVLQMAIVELWILQFVSHVLLLFLFKFRHYVEAIRLEQSQQLCETLSSVLIRHVATAFQVRSKSRGCEVRHSRRCGRRCTSWSTTSLQNLCKQPQNHQQSLLGKKENSNPPIIVVYIVVEIHCSVWLLLIRSRPRVSMLTRRTKKSRFKGMIIKVHLITTELARPI